MDIVGRDNQDLIVRGGRMVILFLFITSILLDFHDIPVLKNGVC